MHRCQYSVHELFRLLSSVTGGDRRPSCPNFENYLSRDITALFQGAFGIKTASNILIIRNFNTSSDIWEFFWNINSGHMSKKPWCYLLIMAKKLFFRHFAWNATVAVIWLINEPWKLSECLCFIPPSSHLGEGGCSENPPPLPPQAWSCHVREVTWRSQNFFLA